MIRSFAPVLDFRRRTPIGSEPFIIRSRQSLDSATITLGARSADDRAGGDHGILSDRDALENDRVHPDPDVVFDDHGCRDERRTRGRFL